MKHILENIYPSYRPTLWDRLMASTSLSSSALRERKTLQEVMTIANPVLLGMLLIACGGGGGGGSTPAVVPLALQITPFEGNPIGTDPINSDGVGLLNENADGSITTVDIGTLTDNKNANKQAYYALPETAPTGTNNDEFDIMGETGEQVLQFRGKYAGDYEASTRPKYTLKIERYDNKQHYDSVKAGEAGAKPPQILEYILNLKNLEQGLAITAADDAPFVHKDGEGFLNEEVDGSGEGNAILLLTLGDGTGTGTYRLTNHTDRFEITGNQLFYKGTALDYENPNHPKIFTLNIARTNAGVTQTFEYTINSQDQVEALTITPASGVTYFSTENGQSFLDENTDGSTEKLLGTIIDTIATSVAVSYKLAAATDSNDNGNFRIDTATGQIYYTGSALDFESLTDKKQLTLQIIRTLDGNAETEQTLQRVINLKNVNDNDPVLTAEAGEAVEATFHDFSGQVGPTVAGAFTLTLNNVPSALGDSLYIFLTQTGTDGNPHNSATPALSITYQDPTDTTSNIERITIHYKGQDSGFSLSTDTIIANLKTAFNDHAVLSNYFGDAVKVGGAIFYGPRGNFPIESSSTPVLQVTSGTTDIIADFSGTDADNLQALTYSLSDSTQNNDGDASYFTIDTATGELNFNTNKMPTLTGSQNSDAIYVITVTVSDGTRTATYPIQIEITAAASGGGTAIPSAGDSAAESVPNGLNKEPQKWEPSPFDNIFDDDDPFGPIGGGGGDGVL